MQTLIQLWCHHCIMKSPLLFNYMECATTNPRILSGFDNTIPSSIDRALPLCIYRGLMRIPHVNTETDQASICIHIYVSTRHSMELFANMMYSTQHCVCGGCCLCVPDLISLTESVHSLYMRT